MNNLKVGDKVVCVDHQNYLPDFLDSHTVSYISDCGDYLRLLENNNEYETKNFITESRDILTNNCCVKVGDIIRRTKGNFTIEMEVGFVYTISKLIHRTISNRKVCVNIKLKEIEGTFLIRNFELVKDK